jgi:hypothetical protein
MSMAADNAQRLREVRNKVKNYRPEPAADLAIAAAEAR